MTARFSQALHWEPQPETPLAWAPRHASPASAMSIVSIWPCTAPGVDSAYGSAEMLGWLVDGRGIEPHVTVFDKSGRKDGSFSREDFSYDRANDVYICPGGKTLTTTGTRVNGGDTLLYRASKADCDAWL